MFKTKDKSTQRVHEFYNFIQERYNIYRRRENGDPKPWTKDPILQQYRFCNVHRENDKVTRWITKNWRAPHRTDKDLWFSMVVARFLNWPPTLEHIGYPVPFDRATVLHNLSVRQVRREQVFTGAYIVKSNAGSKIKFVVNKLFQPCWDNRERLRPQRGMQLADYYEVLRSQYGFGSFMAAQIIADLKYVEPLQRAGDWNTWAASGPGSRRGLQYVLEGGTVERNVSWSEEEWLRALQALHIRIEGLRLRTMHRMCAIPPIHAQDLQNCLCEFSKYVRVQQGVGRPRSTYPGV